MNAIQHTSIPTFESVWTLLQENAQQQKENERFLTEKFAETVFYPELEQECIRQSIAIIKQVGDSVVICDEHLKVF